MEALNYAGSGGGIYVTNGSGTLSVTLTPSVTSIIATGNIEIGSGGIRAQSLLNIDGSVNTSGGSAQLLRISGTVNAQASNDIPYAASIGGTFTTSTYNNLQWYTLALQSITATGSGTINQATQLLVQPFNVSGPTATYVAGISIAKQTAGTNNIDLVIGLATNPTTGNWGIYQVDNYANYFSGTVQFASNVSIGATPVTTIGFNITSNVTGAYATGINSGAALNASANNQTQYAFAASPIVATAGYTGLTYYGYFVNTPSITGGGTIFTAAQIYILQAPTTGSTTTYGIYQSGSDPNYFTGSFRINSNVSIGSAIRTQNSLNVDISVTTTSGSGGTFRISGGTVNASANSDLIYNAAMGGTFNTGTYSSLTYQTLLVNNPTFTGTGTISSALGLQVSSIAAGTATLTSLAGIGVNTQTAGTNNVDILFGTLTIPSGNHGIYQGDTYANYLGGSLTVNANITFTPTTSTSSASYLIPYINATSQGSSGSFITTTGFYFNPGLSIFGIPGQLYLSNAIQLSATGSSSQNLLNIFETGLSNGNLVTINLGSANSSNNELFINFVQNATASYAQFGILGDGASSGLTLTKGSAASFGGTLSVSGNFTALGSNHGFGSSPFLTSATYNYNFYSGTTTSGSGAIVLGQSSSYSLNVVWYYNATAANAYAVIGTYNASNPITIQASTLTLQSGGSNTIYMNSSQQTQFYNVVGIGGLFSTIGLYVGASLTGNNSIGANFSPSITTNGNGQTVYGIQTNMSVSTGAYTGGVVYMNIIGTPTVNTTGGGTITTNIQLLIQSCYSSATTKWGIYQSGTDPNYLAGNVWVNGIFSTGGNVNSLYGINVVNSFVTNGSAGMLVGATFAPSTSGYSYTGISLIPVLTTTTQSGTNYTGINVGTPTKTGSYGLNISYQIYIAACATSSTSWGIYQGGTDGNYLGGSLQINGNAGIGNIATSNNALIIGSAITGGSNNNAMVYIGGTISGGTNRNVSLFLHTGVTSDTTINSGYGIQNSIYFTDSANSQTFYGHYAYNPLSVSHTGATFATIYIDNQNISGTGTVSTSYQIYIGSCSTATTTYGIYQSGSDLNYLGGALTVAGTLTHNGSVKFSTSGATPPGSNSTTSSSVNAYIGVNTNAYLTTPTGWLTIIDSGGTSRKVPYY